MANYANISEVLTNKCNNAALKVESLEMVINEITQPTVLELEKRYINGEDVGEALDEAYEAHDKAFSKLEERRIILEEYTKARELYLEALKHVERANNYEVYGF